MSLVSANKTETNTYALEIAIAAEDFKAAVQHKHYRTFSQFPASERARLLST